MKEEIVCLECLSSVCNHALVARYSAELPEVVVNAIVKSFPYDHRDILARTKWNGLNGCYHFDYAGMYVGVEEDGYIHT